MKKPIAVLAIVSVVSVAAWLWSTSSDLCFDGMPVHLPVTESKLMAYGYSVKEASGSNAIYEDSQGRQLFMSVATAGNATEIYADTLMSENSNMQVYGGIKLGSSEERVQKFYGDPTFDMGRGKLYSMDLTDSAYDKIYVATLDGEVIHIEMSNDID